MALIRPTLGELIRTGESEINALIPGADARLRFSVLNVFARIWAGLVDGLYGALTFLSRQLFAVTATSQYLTLIADSYGITRLSAQAAAGCITITGTAGSAVLTGAIFVRGDGVQYQTTASAIIPASGFIDVPVTALTTGAGGNAVANVAMQPAAAVAGLTSAAVCAAAIAGGSDDETDEQLRARLLQRLRVPPGVGTASDWQTWAFSMSSAVTRVWVVPAIYGNGTVGIVFAQDTTTVVPPPSAIAQMQAHLASFAPVGIAVTVFAPTLKPVNFSIHEEPSLNPDVRTAITLELQDFLYREGGPGNVLVLSRINEAISAAAGEYDHTLVAPAAPVSIAATAPLFEIAVLGTISWV